MVAPVVGCRDTNSVGYCGRDSSGLGVTQIVGYCDHDDQGWGDTILVAIGWLDRVKVTLSKQVCCQQQV